MTDSAPGLADRPVARGRVLGRGYEQLLRPAMFAAGDAETMHRRMTAVLRRLSRRPVALSALSRVLAVPRAPVRLWGLEFPNPVGLAAGLDKDGVALPAWPALGFGFLEAGTVTWHAQPGNPGPRLFRLPHSAAIVNRMGFNNHGALALAASLAETGPVGVPVGVSIGKSKITPLTEAVPDYLASFAALARFASYIAVNVSSPNTPGLRELQDAGALAELLSALRHAATQQAAQRPGADAVPLLVKLAPDLSDVALGQAVQVCLDAGIDGLITTNTTLSRDGVAPADAVIAGEAGGLSGAPLRARAVQVCRFVHEETDGALPIIGVGGLGSADDAEAMFDAGARLVQLYSGFIYRGPALIGQIARNRAGAQGGAKENR